MKPCFDNRFCASITEEDRECLCAVCCKSTFAKGEVVDARCFERRIMLILDGAIALTKSSTGKMQVLNTACDIIGHEYLFKNEYIKYSDVGTIVAFRDTTVAWFPLPDLRKAFFERPFVARALFMNVSVNDNRKAFYRLMVQMEDAYHAVLYMMLYLQRRRIAPPTHEELAFLTGLNRVTVTKAVGEILRSESYTSLREYMEDVTFGDGASEGVAHHGRADSGKEGR